MVQRSSDSRWTVLIALLVWSHNFRVSSSQIFGTPALKKHQWGALTVNGRRGNTAAAAAAATSSSPHAYDWLKVTFGTRAMGSLFCVLLASKLVQQ